MGPSPSTSSDYRWVTIGAEGYHFLQPVFRALAVRSLCVLTESADATGTCDRARHGGLVTALAEHHGRTVAVVWSDFRFDGGCYTHATARRLTAFLRELKHRADGGPPLFFLVSSAGVSLMQGRTLFSDAFQLWPELLDYSRDHLLVTCALGKCLGLAALLFGLGHYRLAVTGRTHLNLTGPEVLKLFFGEAVDFEQQAAAVAIHQRTDLVHELVPDVEAAFECWLGLLEPGSHGAPPARDGDDATAELLALFLDRPPRELLPGRSESVRVFLGTRRGRPLGLFVNPPRRTENLIDVRTLESYEAGLDLFRALRLPIVSFLDSPGLDPRFEQSDANNIRKLLAVGERLIHYPYPAMGVVTGRCFGGASSLTIPKVFGGRRALALRGSSIGVMQASIVDQLLRQSPRLHEQWLRSAAMQGPGLEDLLASGMLDAVIDPHQLAGEIDRFLDGSGLRNGAVKNGATKHGVPNGAPRNGVPQNGAR